MPYIGKKPADIIATAVDTTTGTFSGEVDAGSLDVSGNADIDGTTNLDNTDIDGTLNVQGETTLQTHLNMGDNDTIKLGAGNDGFIYSDGTNLIVEGQNADSEVRLLSDDRVIIASKAFGESFAIFNDDGAVDLYFDGNKKLATKTDGVDITGELQSDSLDVDGDADIDGTLNVQGETTLQTHLNMGDGDIIKLGANADLTIQHDGSNSIITDAGTGRLQIQGSRVDINKNDGSEGMAAFIEDAQVILYHNNVVKLQTASTGINVTGGIGLGGTGSANILDDYEEGTWTPTIGGSSSDPTVSYTGNRSGSYIKVGDVVHVMGRVHTSSVSGGSGTALIRGLPFATSAERNAGALGYISQVSNSSGYTQFGLNPDASASTIRIVQSGSGLGGATVSVGVIGNGFDLTFSHTYKV